MARFFVDFLPVEGTSYTLSGANADHAKVLRLRPGETVTLCDGAGSESKCTVQKGLTLLVGATFPSPAETRNAASVYLAFPKGDKAEHVIQKATELGAAEICLFPSRYCVSRPEGKALEKKLERWQKIARSAAEQSGRGIIPSVRAVDSYREALAQAGAAELPLLFYENEEQLSLRRALADRTAPARGAGASEPLRISLMTGAEGGFSEEEILQAREVGLRICTLGPRILRCETAPLAALSAVLYALGDL